MKYNLVFLTLLVSSLAWSAPASFTYEGVLTNAGVPVTTQQFILVEILAPLTDCILYKKGYTRTPSTDGGIALVIDSASATLATEYSSNFNSIFKPTVTATCLPGSGAGSYTSA